MFRPRTALEAIDLVSKLLEYTLEVWLSTVGAMVYSFFDGLQAERAMEGISAIIRFYTRRFVMGLMLFHVCVTLTDSGGCRAVGATRPDSQACATTL